MHSRQGSRVNHATIRAQERNALQICTQNWPFKSRNCTYFGDNHGRDTKSRHKAKITVITAIVNSWFTYIPTNSRTEINWCSTCYTSSVVLASGIIHQFTVTAVCAKQTNLCASNDTGYCTMLIIVETAAACVLLLNVRYVGLQIWRLRWSILVTLQHWKTLHDLAQFQITWELKSGRYLVINSATDHARTICAFLWLFSRCAGLHPAHLKCMF